MRKLILAASTSVALFLGSTFNASASTTWTTTQSGLWNVAATWGGGGTPANYDPVVITNGFAVTIPQNLVVHVGSMSFNNGSVSHYSTLISSGVLFSSGVFMGSDANAAFSEIDLSSTSITYISTYNWVMGAASTSGNRIHSSGTPTGYAVFNSSGGSFTQGAQGGFDQSDFKLYYTSFTGLGTMGLSYATVGFDFVMSSCVWQNSGTLRLPQEEATPGANRYVEYSDIRAPTTLIAARVSASNIQRPTNRNDFTHVTIDSATMYGGAEPYVEVDATSVTLTGSVLRNVYWNMVGAFGTNVNFYNNVIITTNAQSGGGLQVFAGSEVVNNNYFYAENDNPHYVSYLGTMTMRSNVFETNTNRSVAGYTDDGDVNLVPTTGVSSGTWDHNLQLGFYENSCLLSLQGGAAHTDYTTMNNNTIYWITGVSLSSFSARFGETCGRANMWPSFQNNLSVTNSSNTSAHIVSDNNIGAATQKLTTGDYNASWNIGGLHYQTAGTYGVHDIGGQVGVNPNFVDATRHLPTWDTSVGGNGTSSDAITNLLNINGYAATANAAYTPSALLTWVQAGYVPANQSLKGAGFDGTDIGAMPVGSAAAASGSGAGRHAISTGNSQDQRRFQRNNAGVRVGIP